MLFSGRGTVCNQHYSSVRRVCIHMNLFCKWYTLSYKVLNHMYLSVCGFVWFSYVCCIRGCVSCDDHQWRFNPCVYHRACHDAYVPTYECVCVCVCVTSPKLRWSVMSVIRSVAWACKRASELPTVAAEWAFPPARTRGSHFVKRYCGSHVTESSHPVQPMRERV